MLAQASPASAATTTEPGAVAPAVVGLTDAATIAVDASLGNDFRVTIAANRTMATRPTRPTARRSPSRSPRGGRVGRDHLGQQL